MQQPVTKQTQLASYQELQATLPSKQSVVLTILNLEGQLTARAIAEKNVCPRVCYYKRT